jgi:hypothetical protein
MMRRKRNDLSYWMDEKISIWTQFSCITTLNAADLELFVKTIEIILQADKILTVLDQETKQDN